MGNATQGLVGRRQAEAKDEANGTDGRAISLVCCPGFTCCRCSSLTLPPTRCCSSSRIDRPAPTGQKRPPGGCGGGRRTGRVPVPPIAGVLRLSTPPAPPLQRPDGRRGSGGCGCGGKESAAGDHDLRHNQGGDGRAPRAHRSAGPGAPRAGDVTVGGGEGGGGESGGVVGVGVGVWLVTRLFLCSLEGGGGGLTRGVCGEDCAALLLVEVCVRAGERGACHFV